MTINHERCSELLTAYVKGELDAPASSEVSAHLARCPDCRHEETAIRAMAAVAVDPLSGDERAWLREQVLARAGTEIGSESPASRTTIIVPARAPWLARIAPALGAMAALLLIAVGAVVVGNLGGSDDGDRSSGGGGESFATQDEEGLADSGAGGGAPAPSSAAAEDTSTLSNKRAKAVTLFSAIDTIQDRELRRQGRSRPPFTNFYDLFTVDDVATERASLLDDLVTRSPARLGPQIRDCAQMVFGSGPRASLPAFAATGRRDKRDVLVLGFAWSERETGPVYRFMMWTWPLGGECSNPIGYEAGRINKG